MLLVEKTEIPCERRATIALVPPELCLEFVNSCGQITSFDISSVLNDRVAMLFMSVRIGPSFAVQPDCLLSKDSQDPSEAFRKGEALGLRMQPFFLPETTAHPEELIGRGLFFRGFHFSGSITQGNISLLCICDSCHQTFRLQSFHAGFGNLTYLYCSKGPHTLVASSSLEDAPPVLGQADKQAVRRFESQLPSCQQCGGEFRYMNPLLCPHCLRPYIDFPRHPQDREHEYYGNHLYGQRTQKWEPS